MLQDAVQLLRGSYRPNLRREQHRVAHPSCTAHLDDTADKFVRNRTLHKEARTRDASLSGCREDAADDTSNRVVEVAVSKDDVSALATKFERHWDDAAARRFSNHSAGNFTTGECHFPDQRVVHERSTHAMSQPADHVHNAWREACFGYQPQERRHGG